MDFESVFVLLLIGIIIVLLLRQEVQCAREPFSLLQHRMDSDESDVHPKMRSRKFAMECCPSLYSNHEGCACDDNEIHTMIKSRGQNNTLLR